MTDLRHRESAVTGLLWIAPWLAGFALFTLGPALFSLFASLCDYPLLEPALFVGLEHYRRLMTDAVFGRALLNTVVYAAIAVPAGTVLALGLAVLLSPERPGVNLLRAAVFAPSVVPVAAAAMIWLWLYNGELGLINREFGLAGATGPNWLGEPRWAMLAMVIIGLWGIGPAMVIYLAALRDVPRDLLEAAALDGLGPWRRFCHVTIPLISPVILFNVVVAVINAFQIFALPYIMTRGGPDRATYFYSLYLYDAAFSYGQMGYASAMAWVQLLLVLLLTAGLLLASRRLVFYRAG